MGKTVSGLSLGICRPLLLTLTTMNRRQFLTSLIVAPTCIPEVGVIAHPSQNAGAEQINTVLGPRLPRALGITLMHEHVLVDFIGADKVSRDRYQPDEVFNVVVPFLKKLRTTGCRTMVDCTPAFLGRDPTLLQKLSKASGLNIITTTGLYGAAQDKFLPAFAYQESVDQLASRWVGEFKNGIDASDVRPGIIKIGVDSGKLSEIDAKLVRAAARTHIRTGLTIASHTGDGVAAMHQLDVLREEGVHPSAFIWVHAQTEDDSGFHFRAAERGAWVEFDGVGEKSAAKHATLVQGMIQRGFLPYLLISQDAGWYHVGERNGGDFRSYEFLFTQFVPMLRQTGTANSSIRTLLIDNPRKALTPQTRRL